VDGWSNADIGRCTKTISNNTFRNWTVGSGFTTGLTVTDNAINKTSVFNNTIENINASDGMYGISLRAFGVLNCYDNTVINLACSSTTTSVRLEGIRFQTFGVSTSNLPNNIYNNTISNLFNAGGIGDNRTLGISTVGALTNNAISIYSNSISNISSNGIGNHQLFGLFMLDCKNGNVFKNKIYNIASNGVGSPTVPTVIGISVSNLFADNVWNIYNNLISDLKAPNASSIDKVVIGIQLGDEDTTLYAGLCNLYYNAIHINASSTGADFGTAGVYHGNTRTTLDMRNNIISNSSTPNGVGKTVALLRSFAGIAYDINYLSSSNNNLFYAGTPGVNNLLFSDSVNNAQTLTELQTILAPNRESSSKSGLISFFSINGASSNFLRPDSTNISTTALLNGNGTQLGSISVDYDNRTRTVPPDIGAYEFSVGHYIWTGGNGTWNNSTNWNFGTVPSGTIDIAIPSGTPILNIDLTIQAGKTLLISDAGALVISPTKTLTIAGEVDCGGKPVTLRSDATGTASIGQITGTLNNATNMRVERFIPAISSPSSANNYGRRWRFISSPVQNATLQDIRQEMFVTGPGIGNTVGSINSNGFDATNTNSPTVFLYNEVDTGSSSNGWISINHIDSLVKPGVGYRLFVRGDRSDTNSIGVANSTTPQTAVTMDLRGTLNQGNISIPITYTNSGAGNENKDGWNLIGNPYASAIDWDAIHDAGRIGSPSDSVFSGTNYTNLAPSVWVYNPVTNTYEVYSATSNIGTGGLSNGIIASGQSFWIKARANNPTLTITESHKTTSVGNGLFKNINNSAFYLQLIRDSFNRDEMAVKYINGASTNNDIYDVEKIASSTSVSSWGDDNLDLTISCRPTTTNNDTIRLNVGGSSGIYHFHFKNSKELAIMDRITLIDTYDKTATNLMTQKSYTFNINTSIPQTFGRNRFYIVISESDMLNVNEKEVADNTVFVYPNPSKGNITIQTVAGSYYQLVDIEGRIVKEGIANANTQLQNLEQGVYFLRMEQKQMSTKVIKIVVTN
jgi:hypothetical protein